MQLLLPSLAGALNNIHQQLIHVLILLAIVQNALHDVA